MTRPRKADQKQVLRLLRNHQDDNGCFATIRMTFHYNTRHITASVTANP